MAVPSLPPSWLEDDLPIQLDISLSRSLAPSLCSPSPSPPIPVLYQHVHDPFEPTYRNTACCAHTHARARVHAGIRVPSTFLRSSREDVRSNLTIAQLMPSSPATNRSSPDSSRGASWRNISRAKSRVPVQFREEGEGGIEIGVPSIFENRAPSPLLPSSQFALSLL